MIISRYDHFEVLCRESGPECFYGTDTCAACNVEPGFGIHDVDGFVLGSLAGEFDSQRRCVCMLEADDAVVLLYEAMQSSIHMTPDHGADLRGQRCDGHHARCGRGER